MPVKNMSEQKKKKTGRGEGSKTEGLKAIPQSQGYPVRKDTQGEQNQVPRRNRPGKNKNPRPERKPQIERSRSNGLKRQKGTKKGGGGGEKGSQAKSQTTPHRRDYGHLIWDETCRQIPQTRSVSGTAIQEASQGGKVRPVTPAGYKTDETTL